MDAYRANTYGLYNMSGNVWEWVKDTYHSDFYMSAEGGVANPENRQALRVRVLRGRFVDQLCGGSPRLLSRQGQSRQLVQQHRVSLRQDFVTLCSFPFYTFHYMERACIFNSTKRYLEKSE